MSFNQPKDEISKYESIQFRNYVRGWNEYDFSFTRTNIE